MTTKRFPAGWLVVVLALLVGLKLGHRIWRDARADEGSSPPAETPVPEPVDTSLVELRAAPAAWLGRPVRFTVQFAARVDEWNPYLTRFGTTHWRRFTGWADERFTWDLEVYEDPAPRLFVRRDGPAAAQVARAQPHDRFMAEAVVREAFLDEPWIEVLSLTPLAEHVPEGTILHVNKGRAFLAGGQRTLARDQFDRALSAPLPAHARAEIERLRAQCGGGE